MSFGIAIFYYWFRIFKVYDEDNSKKYNALYKLFKYSDDVRYNKDLDRDVNFESGSDDESGATSD